MNWARPKARAFSASKVISKGIGDCHSRIPFPDLPPMATDLPRASISSHDVHGTGWNCGQVQAGSMRGGDGHRPSSGTDIRYLKALGRRIFPFRGPATLWPTY